MSQSLIQDLPNHNVRANWTSNELAAVWLMEELYSNYEHGDQEPDDNYDTVMNYFDIKGNFKAFLKRP